MIILNNAVESIYAYNYVKVATIGTYPKEVDKSKGMQHVVGQFIDQIEILKNNSVRHASLYSHITNNKLYNRFEGGEGYRNDK